MKALPFKVPEAPKAIHWAARRGTWAYLLALPLGHHLPPSRPERLLGYFDDGEEEPDIEEYAVDDRPVKFTGGHVDLQFSVKGTAVATHIAFAKDGRLNFWRELGRTLSLRAGDLVNISVQL